MTYFATAYEYAKANNLTAAQVAGSTYQQIAAACGVAIGANGDSPADFRYLIIRRKIALKLRAEEIAAANESRRSAVLAKIQELAGEHDATAEFVMDGDTVEGPCIVIRRAE